MNNLPLESMLDARETVLVVAYYFPPMGLSGVQRITKFVKYLPQFGWRPIVLTPTNVPAYAYDPSLLQDVQQPEIRIVRIQRRKTSVQQKSAAAYYPPRFLQRLYHFLTSWYAIPDTKRWWRKHALPVGRSIIHEERVNVILATAPPFTNFLIGAQLAEEFDLPLVIDYRDPWVDNTFHIYPTPYHRLRHRALEEKVLRRATAVIVLTRWMKERLLQHYRFLRHSDVSIIPHGYDPEDFALVPQQSVPADKFVLTYSGLFQDNRTPRFFLQALSRVLRKNPAVREQVELRFVGLLRKRDLRLLRRYGLASCTRITGYIPHVELVEHLLQSTVLWLMLRDHVRTPEKLFEYFGAQKPILAMLDNPALMELLKHYGAAVVVNPTDSSAIERAIQQLIDQWQAGQLPQPDEEFVKQFDRRWQTETLATILRQVIPIDR